MTEMLRLGIPSKGRLQEDTFAYFDACGLKIRRTGNAREYAGIAKGIPGVEIAFLQAGEIPSALAKGSIHLGVTGEDLIREKLSDGDAATALVRTMGFGRADLIVAVPQSWIDVERMADLDDAAAAFRATHGFPMRVATKYLNLTRAYFRAKGLAHYRLAESDGATEGAPAAQSAEIVVDITSSGETLRANHLKIIEDGLILRSEAQLRASMAAEWNDRTLETLRILVERIEAREAARGRVVLRCALTNPVREEVEAALEALGASIIAMEGATVTVGTPKDVAYEASLVLRVQGARRVDSVEPAMLYGAGGDVFDRIREKLLP